MSDEMIPTESEILLYTTSNGDVRVEVFYQSEPFWLSQRRMAELFGVEAHTITYHCKEIFASKELAEEGTTRKIRVVKKEGGRDVSSELDFYNLDMVIAWATASTASRLPSSAYGRLILLGHKLAETP